MEDAKVDELNQEDFMFDVIDAINGVYHVFRTLLIDIVVM